VFIIIYIELSYPSNPLLIQRGVVGHLQPYAGRRFVGMPDHRSKLQVPRFSA